MLIDTHCHLHDQEWFTPEQAEQEIAAAHQAGVSRVICIGTDPADSLAAQAFAAQHPETYWTYGIHPEFATRPVSPSASAATNASAATAANPQTELTPSALPIPRDSRLLAIGEIGLDYHYSSDPAARTAQIHLFEAMLDLAVRHQLPVSLHLREAFADAWPILDNFSPLTGVVHCFTGSKRDLKNALDRGFYIGVGGLATYTTNPLPPLDRLLLETDAPFLTPAPFRGKINSPRYIKIIALYLAEQLGVAFSSLEEQTTQNVRNLFNF